jgi:hypothetical protein
MPIDNELTAGIQAISTILKNDESIVQIRSGQPQPGSHADYFTRYKVDLAVKSADGTTISRRRCVVVKVSSNTGLGQVDLSADCASVPNVGGL